MKLAVGHLAGADQFLAQAIELQAAEQIGGLIERGGFLKRTPYFGDGVFPLVAYAVNQEIDGLLGRHLAQVKTERENDARASVHSPEQRANTVFSGLLKFHVPQQELPIERPALRDERCSADGASVGAVPSRHVALKVVARDELVEDGGARERNIVPAHAHHLLLEGHGGGR